MNTPHFLVKGLFFIQVLLGLFFVEYSNSKLKTEEILCQKSVRNEVALGIWEYTMSEVKSPYKEGILFITKEEGAYTVAVKFSNGVLSGQDVDIKDNRVNFNMNISGLERVSFVLMVEGDQIRGESYSVNGSSQILGNRKYKGE